MSIYAFKLLSELFNSQSVDFNGFLSNIYFAQSIIPLVQFFGTINLTVYVLIIIIITLCSIIVYLLFSNRRIWLELNKVEQQLLLTQINPHFIFNSLTAIQSFIFRKDPLQAGKYLSSFAKLIRLILENSRLESASIEREIKTLRLYFDLQTLRFEGKFDCKIEIDETIDLEETTIPPMLIQPFIENSIEHGFIQLSEKGIITVRFRKAKNSIVIEMEDNGIGVEKSMLVHLKAGRSHQTHATEITFKRLRKIKLTNKLNIELDIIDLNTLDITKHGSIVRFTVPVK